MPSQIKIQLPDEQLEEFAAFYEGDRSRLVGLLIRAGASRADAEDAAQEAMLAALKDWPTIASPKAYVRTVATRTLYRTWEKAERGDIAERRVTQDTMVAALDANEDADKALEMLAALSPAQRMAFALHVDGHDDAEIAQITGTHPDTVRSNRRYARQKLIRMLDSESIRKEATHGP
ncbi:RNA polymerase sigma factor [Paractinoplanes rhizophilus]|uniref:RNA polymerase sigma factor n=1 Tax=Paractinoplanes rhizophilus TaxID=1416877 RepID=A0ABW2I4P3_9ACTN